MLVGRFGWTVCCCPSKHFDLFLIPFRSLTRSARSLLHLQGILLGAQAGGNNVQIVIAAKAKALSGSGRVGGCAAGCMWSGVSARLASCFSLNKSAAAFYGKQAG